MLADPPLLTIQTPKRRPTQAQVDALGQHPTGALSDAMNGVGALPSDIRPFAPGLLPDHFCGVALTCSCAPADILGTLAAISELQSGDVLVSATGSWRSSAAAGDHLMGMARNAGAVGYVTDGMMRDRPGVIAAGLPAYCAGFSPNSPHAKGPGTVGLPVLLGSVRIESGDVVVADHNGVVIVPFDKIDLVIQGAARIAEMEEALGVKVKAGLTLLPSVQEILESDKVMRL